MDPKTQEKFNEDYRTRFQSGDERDSDNNPIKPSQIKKFLFVKTDDKFGINKKTGSKSPQTPIVVFRS